MIDNKIVAPRDCMGCYACDNICPQKCISMNTDDEGFWYPYVNYNDCIRCGKCIDVCPIISRKHINRNPEAMAATSIDSEIRKKSSSGGVFTLIAENILEMDGRVFGAAFDNDFLVEHISVAGKDNLNLLRGSKYLQSKLGQTYNHVKDSVESGQNVLFTGTPCQVAGLKSYLGREYDNLLCLDIICHGVPSPKVWQKYLKFREKIAQSSAKEISFRNKSEGWSRFSLSMIFENESSYCKPFTEDLYMRAFLADICLRPSCYDCEFKGINRQSDITLADFWGIKEILPNMDDDKGTSLLFINSEIGRKAIKLIENKMLFNYVDINEAIKSNSAAIKSARKNPRRNSFLNALDDVPFDKLVNKYTNDTRYIRIKRRIKSFINKIGFEL